MLFIYKLFNYTIILIILFVVFISIFFIPVLGNTNFSNSNTNNLEILDFNPNGFVWPLPGYTRISSPFGKRNAPTGGASSSHSGIDIPAPPGTKFIAVHDGEITFRQFLGAGRIYNYYFI